MLDRERKALLPRAPFGLGLCMAGILTVAACSPSPSGAPASTSAPAPTAKPAASSPAAVSAAPSPSAAAPSASPSPAASSASPVAGTTANTVQLTDALRFDPATLTVPRGTTVTWRNTSQVPHTVTDDPSKAASASDAQLPSGAQPWDSGNLNPGQTFTHTFDTPGTYKYFCQPHEAGGMVGTITVT
jgi:plastocyanin